MRSPGKDFHGDPGCHKILGPQTTSLLKSLRISLFVRFQRAAVSGEIDILNTRMPQNKIYYSTLALTLNKSELFHLQLNLQICLTTTYSHLAGCYCILTQYTDN